MSLLKTLKRNWFNIAAGLLGLVLLGNLFGGFNKLHLLWKQQTDRSLVSNQEAWREWLNRNRNLFGSLKVGAQIGITKNLNDDYGLVWIKQQGNMDVQRTNKLRNIGPGIILEFDDEVAKDLQWKKNRDEAVIFLRHRSQIGKTQTYYLKKEDKLKAEGFLEFLRNIGLRPSS